MARPTAYVYVDGFNLYYGLKASCDAHPRGLSWRWLNFEELFRRTLNEFDVQKIRYYTAPLNPPYWAKAKRQGKFLRALETLGPDLIEIHKGKYVVYEDELPLKSDDVQHPWEAERVEVLRSEEKQSDVALATWMLMEGLVEDLYEVAVVVSNDSDQLPAIRMMREYGFTVGVLNPHLRNPSNELRDIASFFRPIRPKQVFDSQFPDELTDEAGTFTKPESW